uniref:G-protein coupled receptors family 1 profile domain-containing protein n=1 Tax=Lepisosteus oculatus TaxID=7918 RepID=W5NK89_LEPOC
CSMEQSEIQAVGYCFESNSSCLKEVRSTAVYVVMYIFTVAVVMLTVCGNLVVIISISHFKQLHTPTNFLMLSLAVTDFLVGAVVMPFSIILLIETCWYFGEMFCIIYKILFFFLISVSIGNVAYIAIDRYFVVCYPLLYSTKVTVNVTAAVILLNWLISLLYNLAFINMGGTEMLNFCLGDCLLFITKSWVIIDLLCTLILPCSIMITLYFKIFVVARKHAHAISSVTEKKKLEHCFCAWSLSLMSEPHFLIKYYFSTLISIQHYKIHYFVTVHYDVRSAKGCSLSFIKINKLTSNPVSSRRRSQQPLCYNCHTTIKEFPGTAKQTKDSRIDSVQWNTNSSCLKEVRSTAVYVVMYIFTVAVVMPDGDNNKISTKSERKAAKTLGILVIVFLLCLVPYYICSLALENVDRTSLLFSLLSWLLYFNSAINPIIYALFYPWFQKSDFFLLFQC